jgi:hypothetical protein
MSAHPGVHKHRAGYRGILAVATRTYATEAEAATALKELRARIKDLKSKGRAKVPEPWPYYLREHSYNRP